MVLEELLTNFPIDQYGLMGGFFYPFLLILVIFFAALEAVHAFKSRINVVLSLIMTLLATQSSVFGWFATQLVPLGGYAAIAVFGVIFLGGTMMWGHSRAKHIYYTHGSRESRLDKLGKDIRKLEDKLVDAQIAGDEHRIQELVNTIQRLKAQAEVEARRH